jgi:hypothetical protein
VGTAAAGAVAADADPATGATGATGARAGHLPGSYRGAMATRAPARSLADDLRARDDAALARLLAARPDLAAPAAADLTSLAARCATRASVQRALDRLPAPELQLVEVLAVLPEPATRAAARRLWGRDVEPALAVLREQALVWGPDTDLRLVLAAREVLGQHPAGLGPPLAEALGRRSPARLAALVADLDLPETGDPEAALQALAGHLGTAAVVRALVDSAPDGARAVLDRLTWGPPVGQVPAADRAVRASSASTPVEWLLARGLLAVADAGHVVLPREVALVLRGGRVHREVAGAPPDLPAGRRPQRVVDAAAAGAAADAVRLVRALGELWSLAPPAVLRSGGAGVRELRRTAAALDVDERTAALAAEVAAAAGLVADDGDVEPVWVPTPAFDEWEREGVAARWGVLAGAWLRTSRVPGLVGSRDAKDALRNALGPDLDRPSAAPVRRHVLADLAAAPPGTAADREVLLERLRWAAPRRAGRLRSDLLGWTLEEAAWLGVTGAGALSAHGRALVLSGPEDAVPLLEAALPEPVDAVLLQADLTAVAPGPLRSDLERELDLVADVESRGGATVYRFSAGSVRRALDAGRSADEVLAFLAASSRTPVPQPLSYLVADVARRHGRVRVGTAGAYLRADDESVLAELLADRRAAPLRLRRLAPTVLVSEAEPGQVLALLQGMGLAPAAERGDGELLVRRPDARRTGPRRPPRPLTLDPPTPTPEHLQALVRSLRAGDLASAQAARHTAAAAGAPPLQPMDPALSLSALREAAADRRRVWIGYVDQAGRLSHRVVDPLGVDGGTVRAFDHGVDEVRTFSVHRVTGVAPAEAP